MTTHANTRGAAITSVVSANTFRFLSINLSQITFIFQVSSKSVQGLLCHSESKFGHSHYFSYWRLHHLVLPYKGETSRDPPVRDGRDPEEKVIL